MNSSATATLAELDARLNQMILEGQAMEAFEEFYAGNCSMAEPGEEPVVGKDANRAREEDFFGKITEFRGVELKDSAIGDGVTFSTWRFDYTHSEWGAVDYDQVAVRHWRDGRIVSERFFRG